MSSSATTSALVYRADGLIGRAVLSHAEARNPLTAQLADELRQALEDAASDGCRVLVLQAEGADFCSGMAFADGAPQFDRQQAERIEAGLAAVAHSPVPVMACVDGRVTGGGVGLVAACDLVLVGEGATFALPEVVLGMVPFLIAPWLLRRLSLARLRYLTLSSRTWTAAEAVTAGLADELAADLGIAQRRQEKRFERSSPAALAEAKAYLAALPAAAPGFAIDRLQAWASRPEVSAALADFADGFAPPWFGAGQADTVE